MYPFKEPIDEVSYFGSDLLPGVLRLVLTTSFTLGTMFLLSPVLTLSVLPLIPVFLITRQHFRKQLASTADTVQGDRLAWNCFLEEHLSSAIPIQLLGQEKRQERKAFRLLGRSVRSQQRLLIKGVWFTTWSSLAVALAVCSVIGYGGLSVLRGTLSLGSLVAFYGFVTQLFDPLSGAVELYARTHKTLASVRQVRSAFALRPQVANRPNALLPVSNRRPEIEFTAVEFRYARQKNLLEIPALRIRSGEHVAIAGENGAGKSTIGKLLVRLYDPTHGSICMGGEDLRNIRLESLRRQVCYVPREPALFDETLASNLRMVWPTATPGDLEGAIANVGLSSFVARLPEGLGQRIGPGGCQLSGGERQRIAIARALLQRPRILILDETTSGLDPQAEGEVLENIRRTLNTATLVVVSHRLSTFCSFQRVLILSFGKILHDGGSDVLARQLPLCKLAPSRRLDQREIRL
jgi:ABC-type bacteriocin/lantibiotic exporter with double-glycine peptidase domain